MDARHVVVVVLDDVGIAAAAARLAAGLPAAGQAAPEALAAAGRLAALLGLQGGAVGLPGRMGLLGRRGGGGEGAEILKREIDFRMEF